MGTSAASSGVSAEAEFQLITSTQSRIRPVIIERAEQWNLKARDGRIFEISVARPKGPAPAAGYPALYVLDAEIAFATLTDFVRNHESMFGPAVVVGVGYPDETEIPNRRFDLTPAVDVSKLPKFFPEGWGAVGGADSFLRFIQDSVKLSVRRFVPVDQNRQALFGHSLGGLFTLHTLLTHPESFDTFVAGSPSIWWGDRQILRELQTCRMRLPQTKVFRRLLMTVGTLESRMSPEEARLAEKTKLIGATELVRTANMVGNVAALAAELQALSPFGLHTEFVEFPEETHNSVIPAYLARGARFTLSGWFTDRDRGG